MWVEGVNINLKTKFKRKAIKMIERLGCTWNYTTDSDPDAPAIEVIMPDLKRLDGVTSMLAFDWEDVTTRLACFTTDDYEDNIDYYTPVGMIDGVKRNARHPDTFWIPSTDDKANLAVGDCIKVGVQFMLDNVRRGERFWLWVKAITKHPKEGTIIIGEVANNLVWPQCIHVDREDWIRVSPANVLDIQKAGKVVFCDG